MHFEPSIASQPCLAMCHTPFSRSTRLGFQTTSHPSSRSSSTPLPRPFSLKHGRLRWAAAISSALQKRALAKQSRLSYPPYSTWSCRRRRGKSPKSGPLYVHISIHFVRLYDSIMQVLVLAPTRELAQQIEHIFQQFCTPCGFRTVCLYGGVPKEEQVEELRRGPVDVVLATPGRLIDIIESSDINLLSASFLVIDEADRILDMGFDQQLQTIVGQVRPDRQTLLFSATWPKEMHDISAKIMDKNAGHINIGATELSANSAIEQHLYLVENGAHTILCSYVHKIILAFVSDTQRKDKTLALIRTIISSKGLKTLVFCDTKKRAEELTKFLRNNKVTTLCMHGNKQQEQREWVLNQFRTGKQRVLVATDLAARGIGLLLRLKALPLSILTCCADIVDIHAVINYDFAKNIPDYVHRIGRTARADATGIAHTFMSEGNSKFARGLMRVLREAGRDVPEWLEELADEFHRKRTLSQRQGEVASSVACCKILLIVAAGCT